MYEVSPLGVGLVILVALFCAIGVVATFCFVAEAIISASRGSNN